MRAVILASCQPLLSSGGVWKLQSASRAFPYVAGFYRLRIPSDFSPNFFEGFGAPVLDRAVRLADSDGSYNMIYQNATFKSAASPLAFTVACDPSSNIRVALVLVWTDPAGSVSGRKQLVNDLDLIVVTENQQYFGNMRSFADQLNTVERVMLQSCPASGSFIAIVTPGEPLKTDAQTWYLVANGPVINMTSTTTPEFSSGRQPPPATQDQSCLSSPGIPVSLRFLPSMSWNCAWNCNTEIAVFRTSLAQVVGVGGRSIYVASYSKTGVSLVLQCSAAVNSWRSDSVSIKYVAPSVLLSSIINACANSSSACASDTSLKVFDWQSLSANPPPAATIAMTISAYYDANCSNFSSTLEGAPSPLTFSDAECTPGPFPTSTSQAQFYVKALSCSVSSVSFAFYPGDPSCTKAPSVFNGVTGRCNPNRPLSPLFTSVNCSNISQLPTLIWSAA